MKYLGAPQSGSMAGTTASHNRAGQYLRNRRTPVTPTRTTRQATIRAQFGAASAAFQSLTPAQQAAWTTFAASYPITDALGQTITLTGQQYYVAINTQLQNAGQPQISDPPTNTTVNPVAPVSVYADASGLFIATFAAPIVGDFVLCAQSGLLSGGVSFNKTFTQVGVVSNTQQFFDFSAAFAAQWGALTAGRKVFVRLTPVNSDGMFTPGVIAQTVVGAAGTTATPTAAASAGGNTTYTYTAGVTELILYSGPSSTGPFTAESMEPVTGTSQSVGTAGATTWYAVRVFNPATGWSLLSTPQVGS